MEKYYTLLIMLAFLLYSCNNKNGGEMGTSKKWDWTEISDAIEYQQLQELQDYNEAICKCNSMRKDKEITSFLTNQMETNDTIVMIEVITDIYFMGPPANRLWIKNKKDSTYIVYSNGYDNRTNVRFGEKKGSVLDRIEELCENWIVDSLTLYSQNLEDSGQVLDYYYTKHMATIVVLLDSNNYIVKCHLLGRI